MIGEQLGSFRIEAVLGTGAMGVVYRAMNDVTGRLAAVKVISSGVAQKGKLHERFKREAEILQQFRHPNIVRFLALGRFKGTSYFAMEYVPGENMEQLLQRRGALPWREVVDLGIQLCDALHYAHEHGVVHRDLKPSNLMISTQGQLKLTDFGIAKDLDAAALTATGRTLGTAAYMAPEQIRGTPAISHKTDVYAMGVVFYQMLTGRPPFEGGSAVIQMQAHLSQPPPRPSATVPELPKALDDLIVKMMAKPPTDRPWDAAAVGVALTELRDKADRGETAAVAPAEHDPKSASAADKPKKNAKTARRRLAMPELNRATIETSLLILALVAILGFIAYMLWPPSAAYLYQHAEGLMASKQRRDWIEARDSYLEPLDRRFPDNPYRKITQVWRDRIPLDEAEQRAKLLEGAVRTRFNQPTTKGEHEYVMTFEMRQRGVGARRRDGRNPRLGGHGPPAQAERRRGAPLVPAGSEARRGPEEGHRRASRDHHPRVERGRAPTKQLGDTQKALAIQNRILTHYSHYTDVADLLESAGLKSPQPHPVPPPAEPLPPPPTADAMTPELPSQ